MIITLDEPGLLNALNLMVGDGLCGPFFLERALPHHEGGVLLSWSERGGRRTLGFQVRGRDDALPAWKRTESLDVIIHLPEGEERGAWLESFEVLLARLHAQDEGPGSVVVPEPPATSPVPRRLALPAHRRTSALSPFEFGRVFVLDLESDCHQRCSFCSTRAKWSPAQRFDSDPLESMHLGLAAAHEDGYRSLRLSGLDPLTHPQVLDAVRRAGQLGFETLHVYSPSTRYAERDFTEALLEASGDMTPFFHVPLYGATAASHDAVTGLSGGFQRVVEGLETLVELGQQDRLVLLSVLTEQTSAGWGELIDFMRRWSAPVQVFLPFPSTRARDDAFFSVATTHETAIGVLASAKGPAEGLAEILPCVRYRHQRDTGMPTLTSGPFHPVTALLGTLFEHGDYRRWRDVGGPAFTIPTVACPHHQGCALADLCPRGVYGAYAERFGLAELQPVSEVELAALGFEL